MREVIVIQLGTRGTNVGSSFWRQIAAEHGLEGNSFIQDDIKHQNGHKWRCFFYENTETRIRPRVVVIDLDASNDNNTAPSSQYPDHFDYDSDCKFVSHSEINQLSSEEISEIESKILKQVERCDCLSQCLFIRDSTEITGVLLSNILLENIRLSRKYIYDFNIAADRTSSDQQLLNTILSYDLFNEYNPMRFIYQDTAIRRQINSYHARDRDCKLDLNRLVAKTLSRFTASERFDSMLSISMADIGSFDPYPHLNFTVPSFVTKIPGMPCETDPLSNSLLANSHHNNSLLCDVEFTTGYYFRAHMFTRGMQHVEIRKDIEQLKKAKIIKFLSWCPAGYKVGITNYNDWSGASKEYKVDEISVCAAFHNSSVSSVFQSWKTKIDRLKTNNKLQALLTQNRLTEPVFADSYEKINTLLADYAEIVSAEEIDLED